jgi:hypothetical protein
MKVFSQHNTRTFDYRADNVGAVPLHMLSLWIPLLLSLSIPMPVASLALNTTFLKSKVNHRYASSFYPIEEKTY